jgi:hypothetical protein
LVVTTYGFSVGADRQAQDRHPGPLDTRVDDVIIAGSVSDEDAKRLFAQGWEAPKLYLHGVKQPI